MLVLEGLKPAKNFLFLRRELHRTELSQRGQRLLLSRQPSPSAGPRGPGGVAREDNDLGRSLRKVVRKPDLDAMVF